MLTFFVIYPLLQDQLKPLLRKDAAGHRALIEPREIRAAGNRDMKDVADYIKQQENVKSLFAIPTCPLLYPLTGLKNPTRMDYLDPIVAPDFEAELVADLKAHPPSIIVVEYGFHFWDKYDFGKEFGVAVDGYIHENYTVVRQFGKYTVFVPKTNR